MTACPADEPGRQMTPAGERLAARRDGSCLRCDTADGVDPGWATGGPGGETGRVSVPDGWACLPSARADGCSSPGFARGRGKRHRAMDNITILVNSYLYLLSGCMCYSPNAAQRIINLPIARHFSPNLSVIWC